MPTPTKYTATLQSDAYYHIYNRTNNKEALFKNDENRRYFLNKYATYLYPYLKTYAYCLMDNHFHLLVQVRSAEELVHVIQSKAFSERKKVEAVYLKAVEDLTGFENLSGLVLEGQAEVTHPLIAKQFQDFFNAYTKAFNKQHQRDGNLFNRPFKRVAITDDCHFTQLVYYIHANPVHHQIMSNFKTYPWSSYRTFFSDKPTLLERKSVINWFGQLNDFINFHQVQHNNENLWNFMIDG